MTKQLLIVVTMFVVLNSIFGCASKPPRTDLLPLSVSICVLVDTKDMLWTVPTSHATGENIARRVVNNIIRNLAENRMNGRSGEACKPSDMKLTLQIDTIEPETKSRLGFWSTLAIQTYTIKFTTAFLTPEDKVLFSEEEQYTGSESLDDLLKETANYASEIPEDFYDLSE